MSKKNATGQNQNNTPDFKDLKSSCRNAETKKGKKIPYCGEFIATHWYSFTHSGPQIGWDETTLLVMKAAWRLRRAVEKGDYLKCMAARSRRASFPQLFFEVG
jgi:hypothetical protein